MTPPNAARWPGYLGAVVAVLVANVVTFVLHPWIQPSVSLFFFPAVVVPAMYWGSGPALLATVFSTVSLAYLFVPPQYSFNIGIDDLIRLIVFSGVAQATAYVSSARKSAEDALRTSLTDLQSAVNILRKVSGWPALIGSDGAAGTRRMLEHAAGVVGAAEIVVTWEIEEEPWVYVAVPSRDELVTRHRPAEADALVADVLSAKSHSRPAEPSLNPALSTGLAGKAMASGWFRTEHLNGRVLFGAIPAQEIIPAVDVVAREVGNSLEQIYLTEQMRQFAVQEERIRLARDLHDGVLQSLTGIRLQLQALAEQGDDGSSSRDRLLAIERAIAIEQRELRLFIDDIRPERRVTADAGKLAHGLEEMGRRLGLEWKTPIMIRVSPSDATLPQPIYRTLRLMIHEAVINALKHAQPSRVTVDVQAGDLAQLTVSVANDGHGFPFTGRMEHHALISSNAGPLSLRDRVVALGGKMAVESTPTGSCVEIVLAIGGESVPPAVKTLTSVRPD